MCQANVYVGGREVARDVVWLELVPEGVRFETFFGGLQLVRGRVQRIDFMTRRVLLEPLKEEREENLETARPAVEVEASPGR
jgi:predicted RNA-binding protein